MRIPRFPVCVVAMNSEVQDIATEHTESSKRTQSKSRPIFILCNHSYLRVHSKYEDLRGNHPPIAIDHLLRKTDNFLSNRVLSVVELFGVRYIPPPTLRLRSTKCLVSLHFDNSERELQEREAEAHDLNDVQRYSRSELSDRGKPNKLPMYDFSSDHPLVQWCLFPQLLLLHYGHLFPLAVNQFQYIPRVLASQ